MELIADGLLIATALTAGLYCLVLSRRLRNLTDSGEGIGAQIAALDRALAETRAALAETREGVSELRGSAKVSLSELARETVLAADLVERIEEAASRAEVTMQRLYQAAERVEAHEARLAHGSGESDAGFSAMVLSDDGQSSDPDAVSGENGGEDVSADEPSRSAPVELPDGAESGFDDDMADLPGAAQDSDIADDAFQNEFTDEVLDELPVSSAPPARPRGGGVLKAERMML